MPDAATRPPNILLLFADQFRADALGASSNYARTPNLDDLAAEGTVFERAYCNSPECIPSRYSFAVGQYPHQTGVWRNGGKNALNPAAPNWMQQVRKAGYRTSVFGKTHLHHHNGDLREREPLMHELGLDVVDEIAGPRSNRTVLSHMTAGWQAKGLWDAYRADFADRFAGKAFVARPSALPLEDYYDTYVGRAAGRHLETCPITEPWMCWVSFAGPHEPWDTPEPYASRFDPAAAPPALPRMADAERAEGLARRAFDSPKNGPGDLTPADVAALRANYAAGVELIDDLIGEILDVLCRRDMLDNTWIVFTSDHGEMNGDQGLLYKSTFFEQAVRVPLIIRPPTTASAGPRGVRQAAPVELVDLAATLVDCAGADIPSTFAGASLKSVALGVADPKRDCALIEYDRHYCLVGDEGKVEVDPTGRVVSRFAPDDPAEQHNLAFDLQGGAGDDLQARLSERLSQTPPPVTPVAIPWSA